MTIDVSSGGGVSMQVSVGLAVPDDAAAVLDGMGDATFVLIAHLGRVNEDYLPSVASAIDAAAAAVPGAVQCTLVSGPLIDDEGSCAPVEVELIATLNAARDALLETVAPFARELERAHAWRPELVSCGPSAPAGTQWLTHEMRLLAQIDGPLGRHTRVLHASELGARATIRR
jgi:hypothetical protein